MGTAWRVLVGAGLAVALVVSAGQLAGADVIDPSGACSAEGTWRDEGVTRNAKDYVPSDVVVIPQEDVVAWKGGIGDGSTASGPEREISGEIAVDVAGIADLPIDDWDGPSERYANDGEYDYEVPDLLVNVKMKLHGEHREEGSRVCGGSVYVQVEGGMFANPLAILFLALMVLCGAGMLSAGRVKKEIV
jgi:hypothetical protein